MIGWVGQRLYTLVFEVRLDADGEFYHLVTLWKATRAFSLLLWSGKICTVQLFLMKSCAEIRWSLYTKSENALAKKRRLMPTTFKSKIPPTADEIAEMADRGEDVSRFFTRKGSMMPPILPIQRVNVDFALPMLEELDRQAAELNISRQAVIKTLLRQALDQRYLALRAQ